MWLVCLAGSCIRSPFTDLIACNNSSYVNPQWTKAPPNEKFCTVISKSYEVRHDDELAADHDKDKKQENHLAEEVDINRVKDDDDDDGDIDLEDVELAASSPLHVPPEQAALQQQQQRQHHAGFFSTVFGRKHPRQSDASEKALEKQRKRIVSDFTAETMQTSEFQAQDSLNSNATTTNNSHGGGGVPVHTIVEGGCESSEHVESDELVRDDDEEESQDNNNDTAKTSEKPDQTESSA
jgi:hypothetical protein